MITRRSLLLTSLGTVAASTGAFTLMAVKDQTYVASEAYSPGLDADKTKAVVYYSRSGHSEAVAREVARLFKAPTARISADYPLNFFGQRKAVSDAEAGALPDIAVEPFDLAAVSHLLLVSPTWMFRPATPLWSYVEQTDLTGKDVVLIMTGNSRFKDVEIEGFSDRVAARGGQLAHHIFLRRGRIYWQMDRESLLFETRSQVGSLLQRVEAEP